LLLSCHNVTGFTAKTKFGSIIALLLFCLFQAAEPDGSPRSTVARSCLKRGVSPSAGLILRRLRSTEFNFSYQVVTKQLDWL
jgi:hypothetical protein